MKKYLLSLFSVLWVAVSFAQMNIDGQILYGNEWINFDQDHYKIKVWEDGFYRLNYASLNSAGIFNGGNAPTGSQLRLFHLGKEIPIEVSTNGTMGSSDFIQFFGEKNRAELDEFLFNNPASNVNPYFSLFNDTSAYFLTWDENPGLRFTEETNNINNPPPVEPFFSHSAKTVSSAAFGKVHDTNIQWPARFESEGFVNGVATDFDMAIPTPHFVSAGFTPEFETRILSFAGDHTLDIGIGGNNYASDIFSGLFVKEFAFDIPASQMQGTTTISYTDISVFGIGYAQITYPRGFNFDGETFFEFEITSSNFTKYLEISNFDQGAQDPILYDLTNHIMIQTEVQGGLIKVVLPASTNNRRLVLFNGDDHQNINSLKPVDFIDYSGSAPNYIIVSNPRLYDDGDGNNFVQQYADYRSSMEGGSFNAEVVNVQQLYDQFAYGINYHNIFIRNFAHFADQNWDPEYLFIIGKGFAHIDKNAGYTRTNPSKFFVPSFGWPAADNLGLSTNTTAAPVISLGRLAATTPQHVNIYLTKVRDLESNQNNPQSIEDKQWMKRILHLGGGDPTIQNAIKGYLNGFKSLIESPPYGGEVTSFFKTSTDPIQISNSEQLTERINEGVSMITFFGHASANSFDYNLDNPEAYSNYKKYPLIFSLGCYTGQIHEENFGLSERFVLSEDKGSIGFLSSGGLSGIGPLRNIADRFYVHLNGNEYGKGIGDAMRVSLQENGLNLVTELMTLHGDPAVKLNTTEAPDYLIDPQSVVFQPSIVSASMESFDLSFSMANIGRAVADSMSVIIEQTYPSGDVLTVFEDRIVSPTFEEDFNITILLNKSQQLLGQNTFTIRIDEGNEIEELPNPIAENNNEFSTSLYILANDIFPVYPQEYSIFSKGELTLKASPANVFAPEEKYFFEIDTTALFNSSLKRTVVKEESAGLLEWNPNIPLLNNTVYYWRVSVDSSESPTGEFVWNESSFLFMNGGQQGWNQSHFFQYVNDVFVNTELPSTTRKFKFIDDVQEISVFNSAFPNFDYDGIQAFLNGQLLFKKRYCFTKGGMYIMVFDELSAVPWVNSATGDFGSLNCWGSERPVYPFYTKGIGQRNLLLNFLENDIPDGALVLAMTHQTVTNDYDADEWASDSVSTGTNLFQFFEANGAQIIRQTENNTSPYTFFFKKGDPNFADKKEVLAPNNSELMDEKFLIHGSWNDGNITSTKIGPARTWESLKWNLLEVDGSDQYGLDVIGISADDVETILFDNIQALDTPLTSIDADLYPYIKLRLHNSDDQNESMVQLDYWRVLYEGVPEAVLRPEINYVLDSDTIQEGKTLKLSVEMENISDYPMDSMLVKYSVLSEGFDEVSKFTRVGPLAAGATGNIQVAIPTRDLPYRNQLVLEINPDDDQLELFHFNNLGITKFFVNQDEINPVLDVTFDGVHIMDGDLVSSKPSIIITLTDENPFIPLNDSTVFSVFLRTPSNPQDSAIIIDGETLVFYPASQANGVNKAMLEYFGDFKEDGFYTLIVQASDQTGNDSGDNDYKVRFEVNTTPMISNVVNYPNPFSTSTRFVFQLSGSEIPDYMKIQIMTVSGSIVREITMDELGSIHIGNNVTDFVWDGTDAYGDRLANGVYLYRVIAKLNGEDYEMMQSSSNQYFKKGIGKMMILR